MSDQDEIEEDFIDEPISSLFYDEQEGSDVVNPPNASRLEDPAWLVKSNRSVMRIWNKILARVMERNPEMRDSLSQYLSEPPKWFAKWGLYPHALVAFEREPVEEKSMYDYLDRVHGATTHSLGSITMVRFPKLLAIAREKSYSLSMMQPTPGWTPIGANYSWIDWAEALEKIITNMEGWDDDWIALNAVDSASALGKAFGHKNGNWALRDVQHLSAGMKDFDVEHPAIPEEFMEQGYQRMVDLLGNPQLTPADLVLAVDPLNGGYRNSNSSGATGAPYSLMDRQQMEKAGILTSDGGGPRKGNIILYDTRDVLNWIDEGMPWPADTSPEAYVTNVPTSEKPRINPLLLPASIWYRSDTGIPYEWLAVAEQDKEIASLMPMRTVIIVPSHQTLLMAPYSDPWSRYIAAERPEIWDLVDEPHAT